MSRLLPLIILIFAATAFAQSDLPEMGSLKDISGKTKVYIACDAANEKLILKEFKKQKSLVRVDRPDDSEFVIEFNTTNHEEAASLYSSITSEEGEMDVYIFRDKKKVIVWRDSAKTGWAAPATQLIKRYFKAAGIKI